MMVTLPADDWAMNRQKKRAGAPEREGARQRRIAELAARVYAGDYLVPAEEVADAILRGRPKWGENFVEAASGKTVWTTN
jgi:hypothetical protein